VSARTLKTNFASPLVLAGNDEKESCRVDRITITGRLRLLAALLALAAAALLVALAAAGATGASRATVMTRSTSLGRIIVNGQARTLYLFEKDKGGKSACYGACASFWPPLLTSGKPHAGPGAKASLLGTTKRKNGALQVTYAGHPLYRYKLDTKPGQTKGEESNAFGAKWYVLSPAGKKIEKD
jgi:predicted lipoprotein with Yx(FWY)xxD motif